MAPALLRRLFEKSPQRTDYEKLLPPTQSPRSSQTLVTEGPDTSTCKKVSDAETKNRTTYDIKTSFVQICPHETLSYERIKRIVHLPYFKYSGDNIGAFTKAPGLYHASSVAGTHLCKPYPKNFSSLKANGFYKYQQGYEGSYEGLVLCVHWTMSFEDHMDLAGTVSDLQRLLDALNIDLCQHTTMGELWIAKKLYRLCNPSRPAGDPVEAYEALHRSRRTERCRRCHTTFEIYKEGKKCHITVKRYLGMGTSPYEKRWLAQCGEGKHRLRSFGAAAAQSWRNGVGG